jgi:hypothetical protein
VKYEGHTTDKTQLGNNSGKSIGSNSSLVESADTESENRAELNVHIDMKPGNQ